MEYTEEKEVQRVYRKFYPKLLIVLPVEGLVLDFYHRELLSDHQKTTVDHYSNERDKIKYFLDNVIYRSIQVGEYTQLNEMLTVMGRSDDVVVKSLANKIKKALCGPVNHSPASSNDVPSRPIKFTASEGIEIAFQQLLGKFLEEFQQYKRSLVRMWCNNYCKFHHHEEYDFDVSSIDVLFSSPANLTYCNLLNVGLLEYLAKVSKNECLQESVSNFNDTFNDVKLKETIKITKFKVMKHDYHKQKYDTVFAKLINEGMTYGELKQFTVTLSHRVLHVQSNSIIRKTYKRGCVCIGLLIPSCLTGAALHAACCNTAVFVQLGIKYIIIGKYKIEPPVTNTRVYTETPLDVVLYYYQDLLLALHPMEVADKLMLASLLTSSDHKMINNAPCDYIRNKIIVEQLQQMDISCLFIFLEVLQEIGNYGVIYDVLMKALRSAGFMVAPDMFDVGEIDQELMHVEEATWPLAKNYLEKCTIYNHLNMNLSCIKCYSLPKPNELEENEKFNSRNVHCFYLQLVDNLSKLLGSCDPKVFIEKCVSLMASDIHNISLFTSEFLDDLSECHTTIEMVRHLLVYSSWYDHSLAKKLIEVCGCSKGCELLETFRNQITFIKTHEDYFYPTPCYLMIPSRSSAYTVMTTQCISVQYIDAMKSLISVHFEITDLSCLLLAKINDPVILYWLIPKTVISLITTKVHQISQYLWEGGISEVAVYPSFVYAISGCINYGSLGSLVPDGERRSELSEVSFQLKMKESEMDEMSSLLEMKQREILNLNKVNKVLIRQKFEQEELTTLLERNAEEKMELLQKSLKEKSKEIEEYKLKLTQMHSEFSELDIVNKKLQEKEKESKKFSDKVSELKVTNEKLQKQKKQIEDINKQLQEKLIQVQVADSTNMSDKVEVMVKKLQAAWEGVRYNLQNIPLIASHMEETVGSDWLKHVDIVSEDSTYLSKLDNICNEIQDMKEWTALFLQGEKKKVYHQGTIPSLEGEQYKVISNEEKMTKFNVHKVDKDIEVQTSDIKHLEKVHHLGNGKYGETSEAIVNHRKRAVKVLHKALLDPSQSVTEMVAVMKKKCSQCLDLHHPNLSKLIDIYEINNRPALITELMEVNLSTYITRKGGGVSLDLQVLLSLDMSQGLEALHRHSLIHGHLHDHNILIHGDQAKISDYYYPLLGLEDHHVDMRRALPYIAPEVTEDKSLLSTSSDVYSLGVLILQVVTGATLAEDSAKTLINYVSQAHILSWLIQQCLSKDSGRRPSATKMCEEIQILQESTQYISSKAMMQTGSLPLFQAIKDGRHQFKWKDCSPLPAPLWGATAVVLDNIIYVSGGDSHDKSASHHVFAYHLLEDHWERLPALSHAHGVPVVVDGKLVVIGGKDTKSGKISNHVSTYNEETQKWESPYPTLREVRYAPLALVYKHYLIVGGGKYLSIFDRFYDQLYDDIEILDTRDSTEKLMWKRVPTRLPAKMWGPSATISNNQLWIVGYNNDNSSSFNIIEQRTDETYWIEADYIIDAEKNYEKQWVTLPRLSPYYSFTVVPNYYPIIAVGGDTKDTRTVDALLMFDSSSDSWNQVASLSGPSRAYTAVASLGEQQAIVVLGGCTETKSKKARNESSVVLVQIGYAAEVSV